MSVLSRTYKLNANPVWNPNGKQPVVTVNCAKNFDEIDFTFTVIEPPECFRLECRSDGDPCWQDSCVEVFVQSPALGGYFNFETNAAGKTLAEFGPSRHQRTPFSQEAYHALHRDVVMPVCERSDGMLQWVLQIRISLESLHLSPIEPVVGNLYKCSSKSKNPSYLCAFRVDTPSPDFHQPKYFRNLFI